MRRTTATKTATTREIGDGNVGQTACLQIVDCVRQAINGGKFPEIYGHKGPVGAQGPTGQQGETSPYQYTSGTLNVDRKIIPTGSNMVNDSVFSTISSGNSSSNTGSTSCIICGGNTNTILNSKSSSIVGGDFSKITNSEWSFIGGGSGNIVSGFQQSAVVCGRNNVLSANRSAIISGRDHNISGGGAALIGSGVANTISVGSRVTVVNGDNHKASGSYSSIFGGNGNVAIGDYSSILGGFTNTTTGLRSLIGNGINNQNSSQSSSIVNGEGNIIQNTQISATIVGGSANRIGTTGGGTNHNSTIAGGYGNTIWYTGGFSFIGAGQENKIGGSQWCSIVSGVSNNISDVSSPAYQISSYSSIDSGYGNNIFGSQSSSVSSGEANFITNAIRCHISSGINNRINQSSYTSGIFVGTSGGITGINCAVLCGNNNTIKTENSSINGGSFNKIDLSSSAFIYGGNTNSLTNGAHNSSIISGHDISSSLENTAHAQNLFNSGGRIVGVNIGTSSTYILTKNDHHVGASGPSCTFIFPAPGVVPKNTLYSLTGIDNNFTVSSPSVNVHIILSDRTDVFGTSALRKFSSTYVCVFDNGANSKWIETTYV